MAGRARKAREHSKKMAAKRAAKNAKRTLYQSLRGTSKKAKKQGKARFNTFTPGKHRHLMRHCGNTGCATCYRIWRGRHERRPDLFTRVWNTA